MLLNFMYYAGGPEFAIPLRVLAGRAVCAEVRPVFRAVKGARFIGVALTGKIGHIIHNKEKPQYSLITKILKYPSIVNLNYKKNSIFVPAGR